MNEIDCTPLARVNRIQRTLYNYLQGITWILRNGFPN